MQSRRKKKSFDDDINPDSWLATYADTITLLLTFFILLYSISSVDSEKLKQLTKSLQSSLSPTGSVEVAEIENITDLKVQGGNTEYENLSEKLNKVINDNALTDVIKIREEERGIVLQLDETILFDPGKAKLKEDTQGVLEAITTIINSTDNDVLIEGNTDNVPMNTALYGSNWELSTARGVSVVRYFVESKSVDPRRFAVKGYGEYKPLVANDTPENRAINRRVDILIVEQKVKKDTEDTKNTKEIKETKEIK
ncbi:flagellar motor protein MotB [Faecalimicrobium sp. JNUCC 81]